MEKVESLVEIVFKERNKAYGAYVLRKKYWKHLLASLSFAILAFFFLLAYPVIASYMGKKNFIERDHVVGVDVMRGVEPEITPPPPPPPETEAIVEKVRFVTPQVVDEDVETSGFVQDELSNITNREMPSQTETIEIPEDVSPEVMPQPKSEEIFTVVEEQPFFPGGESELMKYLHENIKYPEEAKELGIQGRVFLTFIVEKDGSIVDIKVLRGIGGGCDEEASRVVASMPKWIPGKQRGNSVRVQFNLPVRFTLQ